MAGFAIAAFDLVLFLLLLFFLLRDGARLRAALRPISPFNDAQEALIFDHLGKTVKGVLAVGGGGAPGPGHSWPSPGS